MTADLQVLFKIQCPLRLVPTLKVWQEKKVVLNETKLSPETSMQFQYINFRHFSLSHSSKDDNLRCVIRIYHQSWITNSHTSELGTNGRIYGRKVE